MTNHFGGVAAVAVEEILVGVGEAGEAAVQEVIHKEGLTKRRHAKLPPLIQARQRTYLQRVHRRIKLPSRNTSLPLHPLFYLHLH
jgi:hypothetical protein